MQITFATPNKRERNLAALAHASILLTFAVAATTGGIGTLLPILIPFFLWLQYRHRSPYVAFHALQATVFQLLLLASLLLFGTVVGLVLGLVWAVTIILSLFIVGVILIPVAVVLTLLAITIFILLPLVGLAYGLIAAWEVYNKGNFHYQWVATWLESRV